MIVTFLMMTPSLLWAKSCRAFLQGNHNETVIEQNRVVALGSSKATESAILDMIQRAKSHIRIRNLEGFGYDYYVVLDTSIIRPVYLVRTQ